MQKDWRNDLISFYITSGVATSYLHSVLLSRSRKTSGAAQHWGRCVLKAAHVLRKPTITGADAEGRKEGMERGERGWEKADANQR